MSEHELWNELGNLYFMSGAYNQAIHAYRRSIQIEDGFGKAYSNLALTYAQQGKFEEAIRLFRRSIDLLDNDKEKAVSWIRLGNIFRHRKDYPEAIAAYQRADELDPECIENRDGPGQGLYSMTDPSNLPLDPNPERPDDGLRDMPEVAIGPDAGAAEPLSVESVEMRFQATAEVDQYEQMVADIPENSSIESWAEITFGEGSDPIDLPGTDSELFLPDPEPDNLPNWSTLVPVEQVLMEDTRDELQVTPQETLSIPDLEAETYYQESEPLRAGPSLAAENGSRNLAGQSEESSPQTEVAVEELTPNSIAIFQHEEYTHSTILAEPEADHTDDSALFGRNAVDLEKTETEIEKLKRVVQLNPRNGVAWDTLGNLYKSVDRFKEAILAYQQAISANDAKAYYYHHLGLAYAADGRDEDAVSALQRVIEIDPGHSLAHATLGGYYRKMGLEELAQKHIGKAMKSIFDSENEYNRACLNAICGNSDQAIDLLRIALEKKQTYIDWVLRDPDLDFVRQDPRFKQLISDFAR